VVSKKTPLYGEHTKLGAKITEFAGWSMPLQYTGIVAEHNFTRSNAGLFDVSHMGRIKVTGEQSISFLEHILSNNVTDMKEGQIRYAFILNESGGVVDDILVYRLSSREYLLVTNAANHEKDLQWLNKHNTHGATIKDETMETGQLALQGPKALEVLQGLTNFPLDAMRYYRFDCNVELAKIPCLVSRTGYTGEDGFEIYCMKDGLIPLWQEILENENVAPIGLGARDTLRLEAALPLYGHELNEDITPLQVGLGRFVNMNKDFLGKAALEEQISAGIPTELVGLETVKGIPRHDYVVYDGDNKIGVITSGSFAPTLKKHIGMAIISTKPTGEIIVKAGSRTLPATIVPLPFYKR
jgi:aminomethyltransferase